MKKLPILLLILCLCGIATTHYAIHIGLSEGNSTINTTYYVENPPV